MKTYFLIFTLLILTPNAIAQKSEYDEAENYHKYDRYHLAVVKAAQVLKTHTTLKKNQISKMRRLIEKDYPEGVKESTTIIDRSKRKISSAKVDSILIVYTIILKEYEKLNNMSTAVREIPSEIALKELTIIDYTSLVESSRRERQDLIRDLAEKSYKKGILLKDSKNFHERVEAYRELRRANKLVENYNNVLEELTSMKGELQNAYAVKVMDNKQGKTYVDAEFDYFNFDSLFFVLGNLKSERVKDKLTQNLLESYYNVLAPLFDLIDKDVNKIDNSYQALEYIDKIKKFDKEYKNIIELADRAYKTTVLIDPRDNKIYPTMRVGELIWMNKNLDLKIPSSLDYTNFAPNPIPPKVEENGTYYQGDQAMQGSRSEKARGICPPGWHIPSVSEFLRGDENFYNYGAPRELPTRKVSARELQNLGDGRLEIIVTDTGVKYVAQLKSPQRNPLLTSTYDGNFIKVVDISFALKVTNVFSGGKLGGYFHCRCVKDSFKPGN
jgi:uncharacterized protein (TIGR02145 family)